MADIVFYKDLGLDFTPHPVTGDVRPITNETAIKRSLANLINTRKGTRPFNPEYGCNISDYLFGYQQGFSEYDMKKEIHESDVDKLYKLDNVDTCKLPKVVVLFLFVLPIKPCVITN